MTFPLHTPAGSVFLRGNRLWLLFQGRRISTGLRNDKEGMANFNFAEENKFILAEERTFLRKVVT